MKSLASLWMVALLLGAVGCGDEDVTLRGDSGDGDGSDADGGANDGSPFSTDPSGHVLCGSELCLCDNGVDDDDDGLADGNDPECTGPFDDDESSFATGIPGDNKDPKWQDCFFDGNSGGGDDGCRYHTECLTGEREPTDKSCEVSDECQESCRPRTPNGCDCFGCCDVTRGNGSTVSVVLSASCSTDKLDDPEACTPCTRTDACNNECGRCELCAGKTAADLPDDCDATYTCDDGEDTCDGDNACGSDFYCQQGCCLPFVIL